MATLPIRTELLRGVVGGSGGLDLEGGGLEGEGGGLEAEGGGSDVVQSGGVAGLGVDAVRGRLHATRIREAVCALRGGAGAGGGSETWDGGQQGASDLQCLRLVGGGAVSHVAGASLVVAESAAGICGRVWDSALVLSCWLGGLGSLEGSVAVELGSGTGLGGIAAAARGARVAVSDFEEALPLLRTNAAANAASCRHAAVAISLAWGGVGFSWAEIQALWPTGSMADAELGVATGVNSRLVLCSDVVYEPTAYAPLLTTLMQLTDGPSGARVIMAHRSRHPDEAFFWDEAALHFDVCVLWGSAFRPLGSEHEFPGAGSATTRAPHPAEIRVLELARRPP